MSNEYNFDRTNIDINAPTPIEVARDLMGSFSEDQANDIAQYVYQPLRDTLAAHILKGIC